jgi:hypothetical protein
VTQRFVSDVSPHAAGHSALFYGKGDGPQIGGAVMTFKEDLITDWKWIAGTVLVLGVMVFWMYGEKSRQWHVEAVMNGPLRANKGSRIYHVPTCPNYESIHADNLRLFQTIEEAKSAGYRPAQNCDRDDLLIREHIETEGYSDPENPGDQQYR